MQAQRRGTGFQERTASSGVKALGCGLIMHVAIFQHFAGALFGASVCAHYYTGGGPPKMYAILVCRLALARERVYTDLLGYI